ncbi:MAG: hypothetical protein TREMPRED_001343 [Tremellales sp. Tagirdzhanova-0007]|nr:MAG: hypothetical protein TREMPRED_001343 [Tremellales sp. Tagirdzhanova-0007]
MSHLLLSVLELCPSLNRREQLNQRVIDESIQLISSLDATATDEERKLVAQTIIKLSADMTFFASQGMPSILIEKKLKFGEKDESLESGVRGSRSETKPSVITTTVKSVDVDCKESDPIHQPQVDSENGKGEGPSISGSDKDPKSILSSSDDELSRVILSNLDGNEDDASCHGTSDQVENSDPDPALLSIRSKQMTSSNLNKDPPSHGPEGDAETTKVPHQTELGDKEMEWDHAIESFLNSRQGNVKLAKAEGWPSFEMEFNFTNSENEFQSLRTTYKR